MSGVRRVALAAVSFLALTAWPAPAAADGAEQALRTTWVGRHAVLRTAVRSNCNARYTDNRLRGSQPSSNGRHRFEPGEIGRVDNLTLERGRIDLLVTLVEPLRIELRDGPFQLFEQLECRVELEVPAPRAALREESVRQLDDLLRGVLQGPAERAAAEASPLWNRRLVEPLPDDYEERLIAYQAWKEEQLYLALRDRLAEALDRAADLAGRVDGGDAYVRGLAAGARDHDPDRLFSAPCPELPGARFSGRWGTPPTELEDEDERAWKEGFEDGQRLRFEIALARRIERCLP